MFVSESGKNSLEKYKPGAGPDGAPDQDEALAKAMELLYRVINASYTTSGTALRGEWRGQQEDLQGIYWKCKELLEKINKDPDKTGFLAMSVLEHAWDMARELVLCPVSKMLAGDMSMLEDARKLEAILSDNVYKQIWAEKAGQYAGILKSIGFDADPDAFSDLTEIMDPLLDALSFYGGHARIYKIRHGEPAPYGPPAIARAICMFRSEKDLADAVMGSGKPRIMAFGAVEKTHAQVKDYFSEWFNGYPEERQRNMMRNDGLTAEEYLAAPCDYTRAVYLCVKSGGACWLVHMPWRGDYMNRIGTAENEYTYGKRSSYAPYQIFYKSAPPAPAGSTMLAVPDAGHLLSELMDSQSMAWYPAFLDETMRLFFNKNGTYPDAQELIFPEETAAVIKSGEGAEAPEVCAVVPVFSGVPAVQSWRYEIALPSEIFPEGGAARILSDYFGISPENIRDIPILPEKPGAPSDMSRESGSRLERAYLKLLAMRISELMRGRWDARRWILDRVKANMGSILEMAGNGDLMPFMDVTVDGTPVLNPDGTPKMTKRPKYPYDPVPELVKTSPDDARMTGDDPYKNFSKLIRWISKPSSGRPPVVWAVRPACAEDYALMAGCEAQDLPEILRLSGTLSNFYNKYKDRVPSSLSNRYACLGTKDQEPGIYTPCFCRLNICMCKREYKSFPYFASGKPEK